MFIGFVRLAHYWTQVHPELSEEEDVKELIRHLEEVSWAIAWDSSAGWSTLMEQVTTDLEMMKSMARESRAEH